MQVIVEDILDYSRAIGKEVSFETIDLDVLLAEILSDLKGDLKRLNAVIQLEPLPSFEGVKIQLRLLFQNPLSNAVKFHHPERPPVIRNASEQRSDGTITFAISDNGIGIDPQHYTRIFGLFQRLHTFEEYGGTGLGLTLCQRIAGNHGGDIHVASKPGEGTTFTVKLQTDAQNQPRNSH